MSKNIKYLKKKDLLLRYRFFASLKSSIKTIAFISWELDLLMKSWFLFTNFKDFRVKKFFSIKLLFLISITQSIISSKEMSDTIEARIFFAKYFLIAICSVKIIFLFLNAVYDPNTRHLSFGVHSRRIDDNTYRTGLYKKLFKIYAQLILAAYLFLKRKNPWI